MAGWEEGEKGGGMNDGLAQNDEGVREKEREREKERMSNATLFSDTP